MLQRVLRTLSLIIFIFLCVNFSSVLRAEDNNANAADLYVKAQSLVTYLPQDFIEKTNKVINDGWAENNEELKEILIKNQETINEFKKATKLIHCDFSFGKPIVKNFTAPTPAHFKYLVTLPRLVILEGRLYEKENKLSALENYLAILRFTKHLDQQNDFILLNKTVKWAIEKLIYTILEGLINQEGKLSAQDYQALLDTLISLQNNKVGLESAFEEERQTGRNTDEEILNKEILNRDIGIWKIYNKIYRQRFLKEYDRLNDEFYSYVISEYKENNCDLLKDKIGRLATFRQTPLTGLVMRHKFFQRIFPSRFANITATMRLTLYDRIIIRHYISASKSNILITAVAIKLYKLKNDRAPDNLQELIPTYLVKLPEDPFDNFRPVKYMKKDNGWIIYSFGPDKQDNQGVILFNEEDMVRNETGDIVFHYDSPKY